MTPGLADIQSDFQLGLFQVAAASAVVPAPIGPARARGPWTNLGRLPLRLFNKFLSTVTGNR